MLTVFLSVISSLVSPSACWVVELEPYDSIPMYSEQNLSLRLLMEPGDGQLGDKPLELQLKMVEDESWSVTLLTQSLSFDYKDVR